MAATLGTFTFDGTVVPIHDGDTFCSALHRQGILELSRSMKYHRARGAYCQAGSCAGCYVRADGVPNVPACMTDARAGAKLESQNVIGSAKRDLLAVTDKVYPRGFDPHGAFTKPRLLNRAFLVAVRFMSGVGKAPVHPIPGGRHESLDVDEIIIGAGQAGLERARQASGDVLLIDEGRSIGGTARFDPSEPAVDAPPCTMWTKAVAFGIYEDVVAVARGDTLYEVHAGRITIATGHHDSWPVFENNDLPGIMSLGAARRLMHGHGVLPGRRIVADGDLPEALVAAVEDAGAAIAAIGRFEGAKGGTRLEKVRIAGRWVACDAAICTAPGNPRIELLQQAGCELTYEAGRLVPVTGANGRTSRPDVYWGHA